MDLSSLEGDCEVDGLVLQEGKGHLVLGMGWEETAGGSGLEIINRSIEPKYQPPTLDIDK